MTAVLNLKEQPVRMSNLKEITILNYLLPHGERRTFHLTYQVFGQPLHRAPVVLINHALTGNSEVSGDNGWWKNLVGRQQVVDLDRYTVIAFDIPGNGYDNNPLHLIADYKNFTTKVIADIFWKGLDHLEVKNLFAVLGSSLGGGIAWEMAFLRPRSITHLFSIATSPKASDWLIGNVLVQDRILNHSSHPIEDARMHAMHLYRNPASFQAKFDGVYKTEENRYAVESWLSHHGSVLEKRFQLPAYKMMNHLLKTIGEWVTPQDLVSFARTTSSQIHFIVVDSDYLFTKEEQVQAYNGIKKYHRHITYDEIKSIHGHDAFLIEYEQLNKLLKPIF